MTSLVLAAIFLLVTHFSASTPLRPAFVQRVGEGAWLGLYSLVSLVAFGWLIQAWRDAPTVWLFAPAIAAQHVLLALMPAPFILVVAAVMAPNPALTRREGLLGRSPVGILRITRHPMLWGIGLWAVLHMLANPDQASWVMFGALALLCFAGIPLQDHKKRRDLGEAWRQWESATSNLPFAAIVQGRTTLAVDGGLGLHILLGLVAYAVVLSTHEWLAGVSVLPGM